MLTLAEIVIATCPDPAGRTAWRSALNRLLKYEEIRTVTLGQNHPQYPESALPAFHRLYALRGEGYEPRELANTLRRELANPDGAQPVTGQTEYPVTGQALQVSVQAHQAADWIEQVTELVAARTAGRLAEQLLPPPEDRLILAEEASTLLACNPRSVGRLLKRAGVVPVRRGVWKRSSILRLIQLS